MKKQPGASSASAVDTVYSRLAEEILAGSLPPDEPLVVGAIATRMDVSTVPVREALRRLEGERLVYFENNRGARVAAISLEDLKDIYATRLVTETGAVRANVVANAIDVHRLQSLFDAMTQAYNQERPQDAYLLHRQLHECLIWTGTTPRLERFVGSLLDASDRYLRLAPGLPTEADLLVSLHQGIVQAVSAGDAQQAETAMRNHMEYSASRLDERHIPGVDAPGSRADGAARR